MIQSNLLSLKPGTGLLGTSGNLQKGDIEKRRFQFGLMEGPMAFLNLLMGNMSFIRKHNGKASEEGIASLQKGLCSKECCKDGGASIHRSGREVVEHFLKGCGFNEREIEKIVNAIRDDSGPPGVKNKASFANEKVFGEGIASLQKGLCSKEGCKDGGASIHRSGREVVEHFLKGCGFNEREIEKIVNAIRDDSGPPGVKNKGTFANEKVFGESIASLQKGLCSKEGCKDGRASIHRSGREVVEHFLKGCGFNEREIEKIVNAIRDDSGPPGVKNKGPFIIKGKGFINGLSDIGDGKQGESSSAVGGIEKSLRELGTKELSDRRTEFFHKGIRSLDNLINESFSRGKPQYNISHISNVAADVNEGDIKPQILIKQIVEGAEKNLSNGVGRVKIALHPPHLGALHMDVVLNNDKVQVILQVENDKVRHILQLNVEQLKNSLHSQGLIVDNVNVSLQERTGDTNYGFGQNGYLFKESRNGGENGEDQRGEQDFLSHNSSMLEEKESGLQTDGRISVFA